MEMCYAGGALVMPSSYAVMEEEEMMYVEGGKAITIQTKLTYLSKKECLAKAKSLKNSGYCTKMSKLAVAQEIHAHAVYGYGSIPAAYLAKKYCHIPLVADAIISIGKKGLNGISLGDSCDKWYRVMAYALVW